MKKVFAVLLTLATIIGLITPTALAMESSNPSDVGPLAAASNKSRIDPNLLAKLKKNARGSVSVSTKKSTELASFVRAGKDGDLLPGNRSRNPQGKALGFFAEYGALFGVKNAQAELVQSDTFIDQAGGTHITYKQVYNGVPVFGGVLRVHTDAQNNLAAINGLFVPDISFSTTPKLNAGQAAQLAIAAVVADPPSAADGTPVALQASHLSAASNTLVVYRTGIVRDAPGTNQLVYQVEVTNGSNVRDFVFIHAHSGKVINRYSAVLDLLFRRVFEGNTGNQIWQEGQSTSGLNVNQKNIVDFSGDSYYYFFNAFGRDSYDGAGHEMQSVNNDPRINCPNANWNGLTTNYCNGVTSDDVVAHEWGHAYTEYTHGLIYQWQSGALNEAYSDIWGEVVDKLNAAGTDSPAPVRSVGGCSSFSRIAPILLINSPAEIAGECAAGGALFGPKLTAAGTTGNVAIALDAASGTDTATNACSAITNASEVAGKIALIDRGTCTFVVKVKNAQNAGAIGVVIANNTPSSPGNMGGADPSITIPAVMISQSNGSLIRTRLESNTPVNVTMKLDVDKEPEDSYSWLMGEDSSAFGGAIRDMWEPTCLGDPGKVTDAEYHCGSDDAGGVHSNSGVPNHGFALLVDGGTYNGQTISALGMVKAAHLYWRAQMVYQTPTSDFVDHADALEQSCVDLTGVPLTALSTSPAGTTTSGQSINAADCVAVRAMIAAVELRHDPSEQCNFQPILAKTTPSLCAKTKNPPVIYAEDFEKGLAGWTVANQGVYGGWPNLNWSQAMTLPGGRTGSAAFAADPNAGNCDGGSGDISGAMQLQSPVIKIPSTGTLGVPTFTFDHYVATEVDYDGGNVKISINGGQFQLVPASAFSFNAYNKTLIAAPGNTNPLAGQPGFSGTDGGKLQGSWGQSQIQLGRLGIKMGDTFQVQFDFGMDGCTGNDGWYVDNVQLKVCNIKKEG